MTPAEGHTNLRSIAWPPVLNTSDNDLIRDFFDPALERSESYDRGVGYFSSGWIREAAKGLTQFASNNGRARWITSPILSESDWEAMINGIEKNIDPDLNELLSSNIDSLERELKTDTLSALSWMIADGILELRLAVPKGDLSGEFHSKFGIFTDSMGQKLCFNGSYNDSIQGLRNYEDISLFTSWDDAQNIYAENLSNKFDRLWDNQDPNLKLYPLPEAAKQQILKLRKSERPYPCPLPKANEDSGNYNANAKNRFVFPPNFDLREYQKEAIRAWRDAGGKGILEMATGSGKTLTALYAAKLVAEKKKPLVVLIVCPYINLATQWIGELSDLSVRAVGCYDSRAKWQSVLQNAYANVLLGTQELLAIVTTNATFTSAHFQRSLKVSKIPHMLIADEVHNLGADKLSGCLSNDITIRLGLSATPERHMDDEGTAALFDYFGAPVYQYPISRAIKEKHLTEYYYHPILIDLTDDEAKEYCEITQKISKISQFSPDGSISESLKNLLIRRSRLLGTAQNKIPKLREVIKNLDTVTFEKALVYCGDGSTEDDVSNESIRNIDSVTTMLSDMNYRVARFTCAETRVKRDTIINQLKTDEIDAVVAIRCMDEGIDIPAAALGFILASSTNSRQIVQRRGRLPRKAPGKKFAHIYDFIVRPPVMAEYKNDKQAYNTERNLFKRELKRIIEFCDDALNGDQALDELRDLRIKYNLIAYNGSKI